MKSRLILFGLTFIVCLFFCLFAKFFWPDEVTFDFWWMVFLSSGAGIGSVVIDYFSNKR